jgi:hypothetical protein
MLKLGKINLRPSAPVTEVTPSSVKRVLALLDHGLTSGLGVAKPGQMCVEAAVSYAMGYDHTDRPQCVAQSISSMKISINDQKWTSNKARGRGMKRVAIAQLGSKRIVKERVHSFSSFGPSYVTKTKEITDEQLEEALAKACLRRVLPVIGKDARKNLTNRQFEKLMKRLKFFTTDYTGSSPIGIVRELARTDKEAAKFGYTGPNAVNRLHCDIAVEACVALKTKGSRYLHLAGRPQARRQKASAK